MKRDRILNPDLISSIAAIGHTEYLVIADAGLPVPAGVKALDLSLIQGIPSFEQVLEAVNQELVIESYIVAEEMPQKNAALYQKTQEVLSGLPHKMVLHEEFKRLTENAKTIVRTGETSSFANVILVAGVNF